MLLSKATYSGLLCSCKRAMTPLLYCSCWIIRFQELRGIYFHAFLPNSCCLDLSNFIPLLTISPPPHAKTHTEELDFGSVLSIGHDSFWAKWVEAHLYVALETLQEENVWYVLGGPIIYVSVHVWTHVCVRGEKGGWKGARGVWRRLCTSAFILLYIYSHPVRGCYMIADYMSSSKLKSMIYKRNNQPYPPPQILTLKLEASTGFPSLWIQCYC